MTALPEGFVPHDGLGRPIDRMATVSVLTRDGRKIGPLIADHWDWWGSNHPADIIAYRLKDLDL